MAFIAQFRLVSDKEKTVAVAKLVKASTGDFDFYLLAIMGIAMAALGLVLNSATVLIGSMLIAPILYPLLSCSLALVISDYPLLYRSVRTIAISLVVSLGIGFLIGTFMRSSGGLDDELLAAVSRPSMLYFVVAFVSGFAATYALVRQNLNEMLPGVAISVALVPPLAAAGLGASMLAWATITGALALFVLNVAGILFASMVAFSLVDLHGKRWVARSAIKQEERRIEKEHEKIEAIVEEDKTAPSSREA